MERGGAAVVLHSSLLAAHRPSSIPCWPLFTLASRRPQPHPTAAAGPPARRRHRQRRRSTRSVREPLSSCCYWSEGKYLLMQKPSFQSSLGVLGSGSSQETSFDIGEVGNDKLLIDCGPEQECVLGGIVALGKFDALHIGHRQLAIQASKAGTPFLLSFVGMAEVLGWQSRPPIVAKCDRKRVLSSWAPFCGNIVPLEYFIEFSNVRYLTPRQFVEKLSRELRVSGVVAGENYRFGYKASGDASELVRLCEEYGLTAFIVKSVMDKAQKPYNNSTSINSRDKGQVSSTRVRHALAMGDMEYVTELLGRKHRLVLSLDAQCFCSRQRISASKSCMLNLPPADGVYNSCAVLINNNMLAGPGMVFIDEDSIHIELDGWSFDMLDHKDGDMLLGIEFG